MKENVDKSLKINELIKIEQLPVIFYKLESIGKYIDEELKGINELNCTEENKQEVKNKRTLINNALKEFEDKRKAVKNSILEKYNVFEEKYKEEVSEKLESASKTLTNKINEIEEIQKEEKKKILNDFFEQYRELYHLEDIIEFKDVGLNITLSASEKSLKDKIVEFCKRIAEDIKAINSLNNNDEVLLEYKHNGFNFASAVQLVNWRNEQLNKIKIQQEELSNQRLEEEKVVENVNTLCSAPIEIQEENDEENIIEVSFTIKTTKEKILKLKDYLKEEGIDYE